jgi:hypothetical protein
MAGAAHTAPVVQVGGFIRVASLSHVAGLSRIASPSVLADGRSAYCARRSSRKEYMSTGSGTSFKWNN